MFISAFQVVLGLMLAWLAWYITVSKYGRVRIGITALFKLALGVPGLLLLVRGVVGLVQ